MVGMSGNNYVVCVGFDGSDGSICAGVTCRSSFSSVESGLI